MGAQVEREGYCSLSRVEETILFLKKGGYHKIGLVFCIALWEEFNEFARILEHHGFEVCSVTCKNGVVSIYMAKGFYHKKLYGK